MSQHLVFVSVTTLALALASTTQAASVRMFLSETGTDDGTITGAAGSPQLDRDPVVVESSRLWVWVQPIGAGVTINGLDFALRAEETFVIKRYHFWNHSLQVANRWEAGGFAGESDDATQLTENLVFVAVTTPGVTNGPFAGFDTQHDAGTGATVIGYVDVEYGPSGGHLHIVFREGSIAAPNTWDRTYLGLDDTVGNPGAGPYDNDGPEVVGIPEPTSLLLIGLAGLALRRR